MEQKEMKMLAPLWTVMSSRNRFERTPHLYSLACYLHDIPGWLPWTTQMLLDVRGASIPCEVPEKVKAVRVLKRHNVKHGLI